MNVTIHKDLRLSDINDFPINRCFITSSEGPRYNEYVKVISPNVMGLKWITFKDQDVTGFYGAKFHGVYEKRPIYDYTRALTQLNINGSPLLIHCGMYMDGDNASNTSFIHAIRTAEKYPAIKVILGHMGGSINKVIEKVLNSHLPPNCFLETSGITNPIIIERAVEKIGAERILFGSDIPWCSFSAGIANINDADITKQEKNLIFRDNFNRLFP